MTPVIALIHSPLTGPSVWSPVSRALRARGIETVVAELGDDPSRDTPFWRQHAEAAARALGRLPAAPRLILAGHSGAGPLLPAVGAFSPHPIAGYVFVDAGLPIPGKSWLQELEESLPELAAELRPYLEAGGCFPEWTEEDLRDILPDEGVRRAIVAGLRPRGLAYFTEVFPSFDDWPDAPCGYIRLSAAYDGPAAQARALGWPTREFDAGHFHLAVDPAGVAAALLDVVAASDR